MGKIGEFFKTIGLVSEEEDDDDDYDEFDEYEEKQPKKTFSRKKEEEEEDEVPAKPAPKAVRSNKVVPMRSGARVLEVCVIKPTSIEDAREITDTLLSGKAVVLNFEGVHVEIAQRIIDFTSGSSYSIDGNLQKITNYIFIVTPPNVDVSGDLQELMAAGSGVNISSVKPAPTFQ